jgi:hypothetical protein
MTLDLDELERIEREATAGPWRVNTFHPNSVLSESRRCVAKCVSVASPGGEEDATFITAIRNAAPALIARARRADELEAELQAVKESLTAANSPEKPDSSADQWCEHCHNTGSLDCHCGGDLCVCQNNGEYPCPSCASTTT